MYKNWRRDRRIGRKPIEKWEKFIEKWDYRPSFSVSLTRALATIQLFPFLHSLVRRNHASELFFTEAIVVAVEPSLPPLHRPFFFSLIFHCWIWILAGRNCHSKNPLVSAVSLLDKPPLIPPMSAKIHYCRLRCRCRE